MSKDRLVDSLGRIDDDMIQGVEALRQKKKRPAWKRWGTMAACFCLLIAAVIAVPNLFPGTAPAPPDNNDFPIHDNPVQSNPNQSEGSEHQEGPWTPWTAHFNEATSVLSASRAYVQGYFTEDLSDAELAVLEPGMRFEYMTYSGYAGFDQDGNLLDVIMAVTTSMPDAPVTVSITDYSFGSCYVLPGEEVVSVCEKVEYKVYQYESGNTVTLAADAIINDLYFHFSMNTTKAELEQAKADFQCVLECFAYYEDGKPDLSLIVPEEIPELTEVIFNTLSEAQAEPDFGQYMPSELPAGFGEAVIRRFMFQDSNYLSGLWSRGLDDLSWVVELYTEDDALRLTSVEDKENYDLSLYPIPRAQSVPDELREIVDDPIFEAEELTLETVYCRAYKINDAGDTDGWRMKFSVKYGDVIVSVSTKGVEPDWLYQQLVNLISE